MAFLDKFINKEKTSQMSITSPKEVLNEILRQASGSTAVRDLKYDIFYQIFAFKGVVEGIGTSTLVANVAQAIAQTGLTVLVIDTSMLSPVQDILLNTSVNSEVDNTTDERLDWFDMPYTKKSVLHISKLNGNISVLSFKGKKHTVIDMLSTTDSISLVDIALTQLHNKFDIILIDMTHELTSVATACLQQAQQVIQVWNDSPTALGNLEGFITNSVTLSCPLDKMRHVVFSKMSKDIIGNLDEVIKQYRLKSIAKNYVSEEVALQLVAGKSLWTLPSSDNMIKVYNDCVADIVCHILNIRSDDEPKGTITSNDITDGKVDGTLTKKMREEAEESAGGIEILAEIPEPDGSNSLKEITGNKNDG